jgi:hypothetical protein
VPQADRLWRTAMSNFQKLRVIASLICASATGAVIKDG